MLFLLVCRNLADRREIATLTYRSGPEWEERFDRKRIDDKAKPGLCPSFLIESYLDYQGESSCMKLDPNSLLYVSKVHARYGKGSYREPKVLNVLEFDNFIRGPLNVLEFDNFIRVPWNVLEFDNFIRGPLNVLEFDNFI